MAFCKISDGFNNPDNLLMGHRMAQANLLRRETSCDFAKYSHDLGICKRMRLRRRQRIGRHCHCD